MLSFRAATALGETCWLDLLSASTALVLLRVPCRHPPVSLSFQLSCSHQLSLRKGKGKNMGNMRCGETERERVKDEQVSKGE